MNRKGGEAGGKWAKGAVTGVQADGKAGSCQTSQIRLRTLALMLREIKSPGRFPEEK